MRRALIIIFLVLIVDQAVKFYVKTHFYWQEQVPIFGQSQKAFIHFTENNGMAFGMELFEGGWGKLFLSLFRILAVAGIGWYLWDLIKRGAHKGLIAAIAFVFAGALGNILDSCFYGLIFDSSCDELVHSEQCGVIAKAFSGPGYASFLHGKVVDMFYFPLFEGHFPQWFPKWGGEAFTFFSPVFNVADSSITIGVFMIIIFQKRFFGRKKKEELPVTEAPLINTSNTGNSGSVVTDSPGTDVPGGDVV